MKKRFVLDGPPGAGKSTILFGQSDGEAEIVSANTLCGMGYACVHESVAEAHAALQEQGIDFALNKDVWLECIAKIDREKFFEASDGITFYDRSFHHWKLLSHASNISLPRWYEEVNGQLCYDNPIFLVAPIQSMDLTDLSIHVSRRFTWNQRLEMFELTRELYEQLGYDVIEVPVFHDGDIERSNQKRIELILNHIA